MLNLAILHLMDTVDKKSILLVEDDAMIAQGLVYALEQEGYDVTHCDTVACSSIRIKDKSFDIAILDMQLPDGTGVEVHDAIKKTGASVAVIYLTVVDDEGNIVKALEDGAADYVTKPFRLRELLARINRTLSLMSLPENQDLRIIHHNNLAIDIVAARAYIGDKPLDLTALEYRLLVMLIVNKGRLLTRAQILDDVWECSSGFVEDNTLTVYVKRLREKLDGEVDIETVRGMGYRVDN